MCKPLISLLVIFHLFYLQPLNVVGQTKNGSSPNTAVATQITAGPVSTLVDDLDAGTGGLSIDKNGNLYSGDFGWRLDGGGKGGDKVLKITPEGKVSVFCRQMKGASGNFINRAGDLYQSSIGGGFLSKIVADGTVNVVCRVGLKRNGT